jgi:methionyl-tRNA formyltransferase
MRLVMFAMPGPMALTVLQGLLRLSVEVVGLFHPAPPGTPILGALPPSETQARTMVLAPPTVAAVADQAGIPRYAVRRNAVLALSEQLRQQRVDLAVVACWPWRIPSALLTVPRIGWLNLHPSPLPELRGPEPLFWALRQGWTRTAMTLHLMDELLDHGPIVLQHWFDLPIGERLSTIEALAGSWAAQMLPIALQNLADPAWQPRPQPDNGSFFPSPQPQDFILTADWTVQRAYAFVRAVAEWGQPFPFIAANGQTVTIVDAVTYHLQQHLVAPVVKQGEYLLLQLLDGCLVGVPEPSGRFGRGYIW